MREGGPVASRTQLVCLCEGKKGASIDGVFINRLLRCLRPNWLRPWSGSNTLRIQPCGGRKQLIAKMPEELKNCLAAGGHTTLMVWADLDDDRENGDALVDDFWQEAQRQAISRADFEKVVFVFAKDRLENWIQFLMCGQTNEAQEGPKVKHNREVADAAKKLAGMCSSGCPVEGFPLSLQWSCRNWHQLVKRMRS